MKRMRLAQLLHKPVRTESGKPLGRVDEIRAEDGRVTVLICGARGLLQRFTSSRAGHRVQWDRVVKITAEEIVARD